MSAAPIVVTVERDLEDLIPIFLAQRRADQATFAAALPARDFATIRKIAHGMVGACASYGFHDLGTMGERIGEAARAGNHSALTQLRQELEDYMARLNVKYL